MWCDGTHERKRGGEVDTHDAVVFCISEVVGGREGVHYAGIVYKNVDLTKARGVSSSWQRKRKYGKASCTNPRLPCDKP